MRLVSDETKRPSFSGQYRLRLVDVPIDNCKLTDADVSESANMRRNKFRDSGGPRLAFSKHPAWLRVSGGV